MSSNHTLVCFCAIEDCLARESNVNYAVRDYILENRDKFQGWELKKLAEMIKSALERDVAFDDGHFTDSDHVFWLDFVNKLEV